MKSYNQLIQNQNMKSDKNVAQHWDLKCTLAGHEMILNFGPQCLEAFTEKMGIPVAEVVKRIGELDPAMVVSAPKTLVYCAIKPSPEGGPSEADLDQWAKEVPYGLLNILLTFVGILKQQQQFINTKN